MTTATLQDSLVEAADDVLAELDWVQASVHGGQRMPREALTRRVEEALRHPAVRCLSHPKGRLIGRRPENALDLDRVFAVALEHDVAVEINSRPERRDPPTELLELARDVGCLFSIDSDAHAPGQLDFLDHGCERAEAAGIEPDRIVNTWPQERLLAWANQ